MRTVIVTGSQGFIGSYVCNHLLSHGWKVIGIDNYSKYGRVFRPHDTHYGFTFIEADLSKEFPNVKADYLIAGAAMIGGISYFHKFAYDLFATNERILANTYDYAIANNIKRVLVLSSSMVFENTNIYPTKESDLARIPPPTSTYGLQKLASEYFARGAYEQYGTPYTIIRPFNCVGVGEDDSILESEEKSGNIKLMLSHVLPDLINKVLKGQNPIRIFGKGDQIRCYTNGRDIAKGVRLALESQYAINEDFNISTPRQTTVLELLQCVWDYLYPGKKLVYECDKPFVYDVQKRVPDVSKAKVVLGMDDYVSLETSVREVCDYMVHKELTSG